MMPNSFPLPEQSPAWVSVCPRPLLPIPEPPQLSTLPDIPSPPRKPAFEAPYVLSTHLIPSVHPRGYPDFPLPSEPPANASKAKRKDIAIENCNILLKQQDDWIQQRGDQAPGSTKLLWNCLNRYVKIDLGEAKQPPRLTVFLAHANGFPKEVGGKKYFPEARLIYTLTIDLGAYATTLAQIAIRVLYR